MSHNNIQFIKILNQSQIQKIKSQIGDEIDQINIFSKKFAELRVKIEDKEFEIKLAQNKNRVLEVEHKYREYFQLLYAFQNDSFQQSDILNRILQLVSNEESQFENIFYQLQSITNKKIEDKAKLLKQSKQITSQYEIQIQKIKNEINTKESKKVKTMEQENQDLLRINEYLENQIKEKSLENLNNIQVIQDYIQKANALQKVKSSLMKQYNQKQQKIKQFQQQILEKDKILRSINQHYKKLQTERNHLSSNMEQTQKREKQSNQKLKQLTQNYNKMKEQFTKINKEFGRLCKSHDELENQLNQKEIVVGHLRKQVEFKERINTAKSQDFNVNLAQKELETQNFRKQLLVKQKKIQNLEIELNKERSVSNNLKQSYEEIQILLSNKQHLIKHLEKEIQEKQCVLKQVSAKYTLVRAEMSKIELQYDSFITKQDIKLKEKVSQKQKLKKELTEKYQSDQLALQTQISNLEYENTVGKRKIDELTEEINSFSQKKTQLLKNLSTVDIYDDKIQNEFEVLDEESTEEKQKQCQDK